MACGSTDSQRAGGASLKAKLEGRVLNGLEWNQNYAANSQLQIKCRWCTLRRLLAEEVYQLILMTAAEARASGIKKMLKFCMRLQAVIRMGSFQRASSCLSNTFQIYFSAPPQ